MNSIKLLFALFPELIGVLQQGEAAYHQWLETRKVEGDDALNAGLDALKPDFIRIGLIAEAELAN